MWTGSTSLLMPCWGEEGVDVERSDLQGADSIDKWFVVLDELVDYESVCGCTLM